MAKLMKKMNFICGRWAKLLFSWVISDYN